MVNQFFKTNNNWKTKVAYIPQKIFILDDTLKNNILFEVQTRKNLMIHILLNY